MRTPYLGPLERIFLIDSVVERLRSSKLLSGAKPRNSSTSNESSFFRRSCFRSSVGANTPPAGGTTEYLRDINNLWLHQDEANARRCPYTISEIRKEICGCFCRRRATSRHVAHTHAPTSHTRSSRLTRREWIPSGPR